jgi:hypothetical protein
MSLTNGSNLFFRNEIEHEIASHEKLCKIPRNDKIGILQNPLKEKKRRRFCGDKS